MCFLYLREFVSATVILSAGSEPLGMSACKRDPADWNDQDDLDANSKMLNRDYKYVSFSNVRPESKHSVEFARQGLPNVHSVNYANSYKCDFKKQKMIKDGTSMFT